MNDLSKFGCALFALWLTVVLSRHVSALSLDHDSTLSLEKLTQFEVPLACIFFGIYTLAYSGLMIEEALERRNKNKRRVHDKRNLTRRDGTQTTPRMLKQEIEPVSLKDGDNGTLSKSDRYQVIDGKFAAAGSNTNLNGGMEKEKIKDTTSSMVAFEHEVRSTFARTAQEAGDGIRRIPKGTKQKSSHKSKLHWRSLGRSRQDPEQTLNTWDSDSSWTSEGTLDENLLNPDQAREEFQDRVSPGSMGSKQIKPTHRPIQHLSPVSVQNDVEHAPLPANKLSPVFIQINMEPTSVSFKRPVASFGGGGNPVQKVMALSAGSDRAEEEETSRRVKDPSFFSKVPFEVRIIIYGYILTTSPIHGAAGLVEQLTRGLIARDDSDPSNSLAIDARMLRTCRQMYAETLPILYGDNTFCFTNVGALGIFRKEGLATSQLEKFKFNVTPVFNLEANPNGRLSMIKKLRLNLSEASGQKPSRIMILHEWGRFLHQNQYENGDSENFWGFPLLEVLTLDFSAWELNKDEGLIVRPFVDKFRGLHGLRYLLIIGLGHEKSLAQLEKGLLREGGTFLHI